MTAPPFLQFDAFAQNIGVRHGFFGRRGGASTGPYATLNCGLATDDPHASDNRARVAASFDAAPEQLQTVYQVHGNACVYVAATMSERPPADAMVTDQPGMMLGILTADCGPVLFCAPKKDGSGLVIGAAHAGWKGALGGILESTVTMMCDHGAALPDLRAALGPCITKTSYQVSRGFEAPFLTRDPSDEIFFSACGVRDDKLLFDLPGYIARRLASCGVRRVILPDIDTVTHEQEYFSYRRACINGEGDNGRQLSVVMIG